MSFRNTFITDYIYQASDEVKDAVEPLNQAFEKNVDYLEHRLDDRGYGYFSGIIKTSDGSMENMDLRTLVSALERATKVPFRIAILMESGAVIIEQIDPWIQKS